MGAIVSFLATFVSMAFLKPLLTRIVVLLGIGTVEYLGVNLLLTNVETYISGYFTGLGSSILWFLVNCGAVTMLNMIWTARIAAAGLNVLTTGGALKRVVSAPGQTGDLFGAG